MIKPPLHNSSSPRDKEPKELDKLLKWQRERRERKLRGEYESAIVHLSHVVSPFFRLLSPLPTLLQINENLNTPMNISAVRVEGATHTRKSFLGAIVAPALSTGKDTTFEQVLHNTRIIAHALKKTDIFTSVEAHIDCPRDSLASPGDVDVVFKTRERGRWYVSSATEVGNNEGSAVRLSSFSFFLSFKKM
jgi:outer membrane protein insertion porin family